MVFRIHEIHEFHEFCLCQMSDAQEPLRAPRNHDTGYGPGYDIVAGPTKIPYVRNVPFLRYLRLSPIVKFMNFHEIHEFHENS